ncbi:hypothetical protein J4447_05085 [Candidatus Pacearchaeota archaeon]|nr:hypothetical protein [Candidatus Pacearchaeota archaeon]
MKKVGAAALLLLILLISLSLVPVSAATNATNVSASTIDAKALSCIQNSIGSGIGSGSGGADKCSSLSVEEQALAVLTTGKCVAALTAKGSDGECWPSSNCELKQTALASLALNSVKGEKWLLSKGISPPDLNWFIQIDTDDASKCSVSYNSRTYSFKILDDKKIDSNAGSCLKRARDSYWLQVDKSCVQNTFEISCNSTFTSNLIYSKKGEEKYYVSSETKSASEDGKIEHKINSLCSGTSGKCDYEGTLWTALVLEKNKKDTEAYLPYLVAFAEENQRFGSYSFLYLLTGFSEYYSLMQKFQKDSGYFDFSSPYKKYYDTATALLSLASSSSNELSKVKDWLTDVQDDKGCWNSLRDTAFILYSGWPSRVVQQVGSQSGASATCSSKGYYCLSGSECNSAGGSVQDYSCSGISVCCSKNVALQSCSTKGGILCQSGTQCSGSVVSSSDFGTCCIAGQCIEQPSTPASSECESIRYSCRSTCFSYEEEKSYRCSLSSDACCALKSSSSGDGVSSWWLWVLIILIVIVLLLILFRRRLSSMFSRGKGYKEGPVDRTRPGMPPLPPLTPFRRPLMRPVSQSPYSMPPPSQPARQPRASQSSGRDRELDETFKKLKEISK